MKLNRTVKAFVTTTLASVSCAGLITATAVSAQAYEVEGRSRQAVPQRVERSVPQPAPQPAPQPEPQPAPRPAPQPAQEPAPRSPARLTITIG